MGGVATRRQTPKRSYLDRESEMDAGAIQEMSEDMMVGQFPWGRSGPINVFERNGVMIISDGHHRTAAAIAAGVREVPIRITKATEAEWTTLMGEVLDAARIR